ncbi:hypothetical protein TruAng_001288 [Truncatella angustata]|nr:hypothetical protein TruAng_001288 [Truncatella angustata]
MDSSPAGDPQPYVLVEVPQGVTPERYQDGANELALPTVPPRSLSAPPGPVPERKPSAHEIGGLPLVAAVPSQQSPDGLTSPGEETEKESHFAKRFMGNMLVARLGRAGVQSVTSTMKLPLYLSPWGDNNPFVLPNLRKRDLALAGVMHFGADALIGSSLTAVETVVQHGATWTAEQSMDQGYDKIRGGSRPHSVKRQAGLTSVESGISVVENERFHGGGSHGTGIERLDAGEDAGTTSSHYKRLGIFFMGISPYRTASTWSQAKVPGEARIRFHLLTHIPAIVIPIKSSAPVCAWSPSTLDQMLNSREEYNDEVHRDGILRYLDTVIDVSYMRVQSRDTWRLELSAALDQILIGTKSIPSALGSIADAFSNEHGGIVMFRF